MTDREPDSAPDARAAPVVRAPDASRLRSLRRLAVTTAAALAGAFLFAWLRVPLPWILGPLLMTAFASMAGLPTTSSVPMRNLAQIVIGSALGLYFTRETVGALASVWWLVLAAVAWTLAAGCLFAFWLHKAIAKRLPGTPQQLWATSYFAAAMGGATEMTLLAEREGARTDLVASSHSLRLLIIAVVVPVAFIWLGLHGTDAALPGPRHVDALRLPLLMALTLAAGWGMERVGWTNPWFLGALAPTMALTIAGIELSAVPTWMSNAAQLAIGISLGVRFRREFVRTAPGWLLTVAVGTLGMIALCAGFGWLLSVLSGLNVGTLVLGTAPGGITEMSVTAKVLQLGVPMVTAIQLTRVISVLLLARPLYFAVWGRRP